VSFLTSPILGSFSRNLPSFRVLPDAHALFVRLSAYFFNGSLNFFWTTRAIRIVLIHRSNCSPFGDDDSFRLETCLNYLTQFGMVSHHSSPPSSSFAFDDARTSSEELVNSASSELLLRFMRSLVNQPDQAFPQLLGIILKRTTSILLSAVPFVLSMNWEHTSRFFHIAHQLICTAYPLKFNGEKIVNKINN
jgi:hypothetical protein